MRRLSKSKGFSQKPPVSSFRTARTSSGGRAVQRRPRIVILKQGVQVSLLLAFLFLASKLLNDLGQSYHGGLNTCRACTRELTRLIAFQTQATRAEYSGASASFSPHATRPASHLNSELLGRLPDQSQPTPSQPRGHLEKRRGKARSLP